MIECGAGSAIPSVRRFCEDAARVKGGTLIRINVREPEVPSGGISLPLRALEALNGIAEALGAGSERVKSRRKQQRQIPGEVSA